MLLCMIETICKVTNGEGDLNLVKEILRSGQELLQRPITLLDGVQEVISALHENYKLVLATKGDLFDQKEDFCVRITRILLPHRNNERQEKCGL